MGGKKKIKTGLGHSLLKDRFTQNVNKRTVGGDTMLHTAEINDGYDWGRLNLQSVTEESSFQEFLSTAELAGTDFKSEKMNVSIVTQNTGLISISDRAKKEEEHLAHKDLLKIPRRPKWDASTTAAELQEMEKSSFLSWRHGMSKLQEEEGLVMTPYEKNLEFWRQLWRVVEKSDVLVQILDARNPLMFRCEDLEAYVRELDEIKINILLLNKADYLTDEQRATWASYFTEQNVTVAFFSAILEDEEADSETEKPEPAPVLKFERNTPKILTRHELIEYFKTFKIPGKEITCIGLVGYPNVGKSSTINSLLQQKKVSVSTTPGKTKHFQTLFLEPTLLLCDCPGLVMPSFVCTKADMVINGVLPLDQLRDFAPPVNQISGMIPKHVFEDKYGILITSPKEGEDPDRPPTAEEILSAYGYNRGFMTQRGLPDLSRCARLVIKDFVCGKLLFCLCPPGENQAEFHKFPEKSNKPRTDPKHLNAHKQYKPIKVSAEKLDKTFFVEKVQGVHIKSSVPAVGLVRIDDPDTKNVAGSSTSISTDGLQKPSKKHYKKNKKEKLRRVYGHMDYV